MQRLSSGAFYRSRGARTPAAGLAGSRPVRTAASRRRRSAASLRALVVGRRPASTKLAPVSEDIFFGQRTDREAPGQKEAVSEEPAGNDSVQNGPFRSLALAGEGGRFRPACWPSSPTARSVTPAMTAMAKHTAASILIHITSTHQVLS
jgi:hypothetical protein